MASVPLAIFVVLAVAVALILRALYLIYIVITSECRLEKFGPSIRTLLCIGSGGHTSEMLRLTKTLDQVKFTPKLYVAADNDIGSEVKIHTLQCQLGNKDYDIGRIPRSRNVQQSYISSIATTIHAILQTIPIVYKFRPDVIFCNGPGTCVPICIVAFLMRCLFLLDCRIVFVESICRVTTLSLTGSILQFFADVIVVQWPQLKNVCSRGKYFGRLT